MGGRGASSSTYNNKEYKMFIEAYRNPDKVNPMTEWSTDWEGLREKYKNSEFGKLISREEYATEQYKESARRLNYVNTSEARDDFEYWTKELRQVRIDIMKYSPDRKTKESTKLQKSTSKKSNKKFTLDYFKDKGIKVRARVPKGYSKIDGATTAPKGYTWYSNGKSRFSDKYEHILVKNK